MGWDERMMVMIMMRNGRLDGSGCGGELVKLKHIGSDPVILQHHLWRRQAAMAQSLASPLQPPRTRRARLKRKRQAPRASIQQCPERLLNSSTQQYQSPMVVHLIESGVRPNKGVYSIFNRRFQIDLSANALQKCRHPFPANAKSWILYSTVPRQCIIYLERNSLSESTHGFPLINSCS